MLGQLVKKSKIFGLNPLDHLVVNLPLQIVLLSHAVGSIFRLHKNLVQRTPGPVLPFKTSSSSEPSMVTGAVKVIVRALHSRTGFEKC